MGPGDAITIVDERYQPAPGEIVKIKILAVPTSETYPDGYKYAFHYGPTDGDEPYIRYDNAHGIHERHEGATTEEIDEYPGVHALLRRFREKIDL